MENELFNIALTHCETIKEDLDSQNEKLSKVQEKVEGLNSKISKSKKIIEECKKQCYKHRWIYLVIIVLCGSVFMLKK
ncbi:hypothetical protein EHP00_1471 [Ecytonucleospora hepatopenaei]|uniref:t-SNARE coiled-coil homology domain-containing protein n=1 Tax=Ecytonucleospora hepatopenaei TaxID=646526 RepID=A0A1W0E759_9MICR|nr:hypothetical protein EHP00_1471 [Ecytonucleospora hepatopenaei]